jgi:hypothetical protein
VSRNFIALSVSMVKFLMYRTPRRTVSQFILSYAHRRYAWYHIYIVE